MLFQEPLPFIEEFVQELSDAIALRTSGKGLSTDQHDWLSFCMMGIAVTNSINWTGFERASLGAYKRNALSWMFCHSPMDWIELFHASLAVILDEYGIKEGMLVLDDTDHQRAKLTQEIYRAHKIFDKKTGGYFNGQCIVFLLLVTKEMTIPVGFAFHQPDPVIQAWNKEDGRLRKAKVKKAQRPEMPARNPDFPTKKQLAIQLTKKFMETHPQVRVKGHLGDSWYSTAEYLDTVASLTSGQAVSQLKGNQKILHPGKYESKEMSIEEYFQRNPPTRNVLIIRGGKKQNVWFGGARLFVTSHGKKRLVIALRYEGQEEYRYVVATDLSWRILDVLQMWTLRWLVEVFIEDFKSYEGWGQLAKQPGEDGSCRGLTLSLLLDHCLLLHPSQKARFESKQPAWTVGSLLRKIRMDALVAFIRPMMTDEEGDKKIEQLSQSIEKLFALRESSKHMSGRELGTQESSPSLLARHGRTG